MRIRFCPYCGGNGVVPMSEKFDEEEKEAIETIVYWRYRHLPQVKYCPTCNQCYVVFGIGSKTITKVRKREYEFMKHMDDWQ